MSVIKKMRKQRAVYWEQLTVNKFAEYEYADPVEIRCRWDAATDEIRSPEGAVLAVSSAVYVDRPMKIGDFLKFGPIESTEVANPRSDPDARAIQRFDVTPNFKCKENLYTAYL